MAVAEQDPNEFVHIRLSSHGDDVAPGRVSRKSYEQVWKGKGWVVVDDAAVEAASNPDAAVLGEAETTTRKKG